MNSHSCLEWTHSSGCDEKKVGDGEDGREEGKGREGRGGGGRTATGQDRTG